MKTNSSVDDIEKWYQLAMEGTHRPSSLMVVCYECNKVFHVNKDNMHTLCSHLKRIFQKKV